MHLDRYGLAATSSVVMFSIPSETLCGAADAVVSFGLVEHFTDTPRIMKALARLVRPGGRILTVVPNMTGTVGLTQWVAGPEIRRIHEALSPEMLADAHRQAGLRVLESEYLLPMGYGVVNYNQPAGRLLFELRRGLIAALVRLSWMTWYVDEKGFFAFRARAGSLRFPFVSQSVLLIRLGTAMSSRHVPMRICQPQGPCFCECA
ncbi:MAG: methyltransferase domain-containing protein [Proteobacteria bacterium]|nr:methyltransferase domain-containing protein [Pseudomonadota bacterium]